MTQYTYRARLDRVVDGDTVLCEILLKDREDLGFHIYVEPITTVQSIRIAGVDSPELFSGTQRDRGAAARDFTARWLADATESDWPLLVETLKDHKSFNRYVGRLTRAETGESLADVLVAAGHAIRSNG